MMGLRLCQEGQAKTDLMTGWEDDSGKTGKPADKKIGAESSDPNRHSQPRLPGSVVGERSMHRSGFPHKITEVTAPKLPQGKTSDAVLFRYFAATSECVMACTERAIRFCTPTLRINFAT
jgi:hypothetical protein